jgi:hypothetical protein
MTSLDDEPSSTPTVTINGLPLAKSVKEYAMLDTVVNAGPEHQTIVITLGELPVTNNETLHVRVPLQDSRPITPATISFLSTMTIEEKTVDDIDFRHVQVTLLYLGADDSLMRIAHTAAQQQCDSSTVVPETAYNAWRAFGVKTSTDSTNPAVKSRLSTVLSQPTERHRRAQFVVDHSPMNPIFTTIPTVTDNQALLATRLGVPLPFLKLVIASPRLIVAGGAGMLAGCDWLLPQANRDLDVFAVADSNSESTPPLLSSTSRKRTRAYMSAPTPITTTDILLQSIQSLLSGDYTCTTFDTHDNVSSIITCLPPDRDGLVSVQFIMVGHDATPESLMHEFTLETCQATLSTMNTVLVSAGALVSWHDRCTRASSLTEVIPKRVAKLVNKGFTIDKSIQQMMMDVYGSATLPITLLQKCRYQYPRIRHDILDVDERAYRLHEDHRLRTIKTDLERRQVVTSMVPLVRDGASRSGEYGVIASFTLDLQNKQTPLAAFVSKITLDGHRGATFLFIKSKYALTLPVMPVVFDTVIVEEMSEQKQATTVLSCAGNNAAYERVLKLINAVIPHVAALTKVSTDARTRLCPLATVPTIGRFRGVPTGEGDGLYHDVRTRIDHDTKFYENGIYTPTPPTKLTAGTVLRLVVVPDMVHRGHDDVFRLRFKAIKCLYSSTPKKTETAAVMMML